MTLENTLTDGAIRQIGNKQANSLARLSKKKNLFGGKTPKSEYSQDVGKNHYTVNLCVLLQQVQWVKVEWVFKLLTNKFGNLVVYLKPVQAYNCSCLLPHWTTF